MNNSMLSTSQIISSSIMNNNITKELKNAVLERNDDKSLNESILRSKVRTMALKFRTTFKSEQEILAAKDR